MEEPSHHHVTAYAQGQAAVTDSGQADPGKAATMALSRRASRRPRTAAQQGPPKRASLAESAYQQVKAQILSCQLMPGSMLGAQPLAESLEMSRSPVTEALKRLEQEGLVLAVPRVGHQVTPVTLRDIEEIFDFRLILEVPAAGLAAARAATPDVNILRAQHKRAKQHVQTGSPRDPEYLEATIANNREFHVSVAAMSGNDRLARSVGALLDEGKRFYYLYYRSKAPTQDPHAAIIEALANRDPEAARDATAAHVRDQAEVILAEATGVLG